MRISTQEEYGLRCAAQLARAGPSSLTIPEIAEREGISTAYAAKLLNLLKRGSLVASVRGRSGGYSLARPASEVSISDVLRVLGEQPWEETSCSRYTGMLRICVHDSSCSIRSLWGGLDALMAGILRDITLDDLVHGSPGVPRFRLERVTDHAIADNPITDPPITDNPITDHAITVQAITNRPTAGLAMEKQEA